MQQMRGRVIAHGGLADVRINDGIDFLSDADRLLGDDLVGADALDRGVASGYFGDDRVVIVGIEPSAIADLSARLGVEGRVVEDDLALIARLEFWDSLAVFDNGEDFAVFRARLPVAFEVRFRKLLVGRVRRLLDGALPGCASEIPLHFERPFKSGLVKVNALIATRILEKV